MTAEQLLSLGTSQVVYLKPIMLDGERAFLIYRADGMSLEIVDAIEIAVERAAENGCSLVTVH
jgi:hypothetical protein